MARPKPVSGQFLIRKSPEAMAMIREQCLDQIVIAVEAAIYELHGAGVPIRKVAMEREVDPEVEDFIRLGVTVWLPELDVGDALAANKRLRQLTLDHAAKLGPEEMHKLSTLVSVGVDIDG